MLITSPHIAVIAVGIYVIKTSIPLMLGIFKLNNSHDLNYYKFIP